MVDNICIYIYVCVYNIYIYIHSHFLYFMGYRVSRYLRLTLIILALPRWQQDVVDLLNRIIIIQLYLRHHHQESHFMNMYQNFTINSWFYDAKNEALFLWIKLIHAPCMDTHFLCLKLFNPISQYPWECKLDIVCNALYTLNRLIVSAVLAEWRITWAILHNTYRQNLVPCFDVSSALVTESFVSDGGYICS